MGIYKITKRQGPVVIPLFIFIDKSAAFKNYRYIHACVSLGKTSLIGVPKVLIPKL